MENTITTQVKGFELTLKVKPGMFSQKGLDMGSKLLIDTMPIVNGTMVADLGCGAGIIGFVAAKLNPSGHVHMFDVNLRTVEMARKNAVLNKLDNVEVFISDLFSAVEEKRTYHQILSNPPLHLGKEFLEEAAEECYKHLKLQASVYWVVQKHLKQVISQLFTSYFGNYEVVAQGAKHVVLKAQKNGGDKN